MCSCKIKAFTSQLVIKVMIRDNSVVIKACSQKQCILKRKWSVILMAVK